ncbi:MAG: phosphoribosylanthranilate isomerase [Candidatus Obscuribacterales bacterium]|nr:phosphoribosylanthranilate isomerase [Steroidobacteraceae bacterium]
MWVKICGLTTQAAVDVAISAGADAIGFVFAASKRKVSAAQAVALTYAVPKSVLRVAVMQHPEQSLIDEVWSVFRPDVLQTDIEDLPALQLPMELSVLPVVRAGRVPPASLPSRMLFEGPMSGTGETVDWTRAAEFAKRAQLILAGGLNATNVVQAIERVRPFGVDVSSGVESAPGVKDAQKIVEFVSAARRAFNSNLSKT